MGKIASMLMQNSVLLLMDFIAVNQYIRLQMEAIVGL
jgi:hypothetical protein